MKKEKFIEICENHDWSVWEGDEAIELRKYSPAGEDFSFTFDDTGNLVELVKEYAADFSVDEHVTMWLNAKREGINGVPSATELVEDAKAIDQMLRELAIALQNEEDGVVSQNTLAVVTESVTITNEVNLKDDGTLNLYVSEEGSSGCHYICKDRKEFGDCVQSYFDTQSVFAEPANDDTIVCGIFTSYWDGYTTISTPCKVNLRTKQVYDIEPCSTVECACVLDHETVEFNGEIYPVYPKDEAKEGEYFYE